MFHPKLSFSFHAEVDRAVDIANENQFRIKENKSVFCEVVMRVAACLPAPPTSPLSTVTTGCWTCPNFSRVLSSGVHIGMFVYTRTLDSGVLIWRTQPYSCSIGIICVSQLISMSTPGIWFKARGGRQKHHPGGRIPQFCSLEQPGVGEEPTQQEPNRYMLGPEQETQLLRGVQRHISTLRPSRHHPIGDPSSGWGQWSHELSRRK